MTANSQEPIIWDSERFAAMIIEGTGDWQWKPGNYEHKRMEARVYELAAALNSLQGDTIQERWESFEASTWVEWAAGRNRNDVNHWRWGTWGALLTRTVRPRWAFISTGRIGQWTNRLPVSDPLRLASDQLRVHLANVAWITDTSRENARCVGLRLLLAHGLLAIEELTDEHLLITGRYKGMDALDGALCGAGILSRAPFRGSTRWTRSVQRTSTELVENAQIPERFRAVTIAYLDEYRLRVAPAYHTIQAKSIAMGHWWRYIDAIHPEVTACNEVRARHTRGFIEWAKERARAVRRRSAHDDGTEERGTAHVWVNHVRVFFSDLSCWGDDEDSPLVGFAPPLNPLGGRDTVSLEPAKIKRQTQARITTKVLELERELPKIRAYALRHWQEATTEDGPRRVGQGWMSEGLAAFWDWALLELLVQSGLRIEEACELTTLDVLRRQLPDGRRYYLLHVKPSKYDRARVIPIGDGLGRVIAEIIRHVRKFYDADTVPAVRAWDSQEKRWLPTAPYLLQTAAGHPSVIDTGTIRVRLARLSRVAQAQRSNGQPLVLHPHDCRRMFASEHLNNATPPHVIQALLGHATIDTVLIYAKLYPTTLVEEYRKTLHGIYHAYAGTDAFQNPTREEWEALDQACSMRDMGTHLCALPTGQHCPKGLVCLGCGHAQPKMSAIPVFTRMLASHTHALTMAHDRGEPAGQVAARSLEVDRIRSALRRAEELSEDVATAIEAAGGKS